MTTGNISGSIKASGVSQARRIASIRLTELLSEPGAKSDGAALNSVEIMPASRPGHFLFVAGVSFNGPPQAGPGPEWLVSLSNRSRLVDDGFQVTLATPAN